VGREIFLKQSKYKLLTKDWEDPDGCIHKGEWRIFTPYKITLGDACRCEEQGFGPLLDGNWMWVNCPDKGKKIYFIYVNTIDKITTMEDNVVTATWCGENWKYEEVSCLQ
jgi:hypothetical protein